MSLPQTDKMAIMPYLLAFIAMCCYASLAPLAKKFSLDIPPYAFIWITMLFLCIYGIAASFVMEKDFSVSNMTGTAWGLLALFSFVNFVGFALFLFAVKHIPVSEYQIIYLASPVIGGLIAYVLLAEDFKMQYLYSLPFIGIGLYIALKS